MSKSDVQREDLKHNFLKEIIMRCDYNGVTDKEIEDIVEELKAIFHEEEQFNSFYEEYSNHADLDVQDPEILETKMVIPISEIRKTKIYCFKNDENGLKLVVSKFFVWIAVNNNQYIPYNEYTKILVKAVNVIRKKASFVKFLRFGYRKVNNCILKQIDKIFDFFEENGFGFFDKNAESLDLFENRVCTTYKNVKVNISRMISKGIIRTEEQTETFGFQIVLDVDVYEKNEEEINKILEDEKRIEEMNNILFELYKKNITEEFIFALTKETFPFNEYFMGVESNGKI